MRPLPALLVLLLLPFYTFSQPDRSRLFKNGDIKEYYLTINDTQVNYTGKTRHAMAINGRIPGPVLEFTEGDSAVIHVTNKMKEEASIHWHGILLPNLMDGVPYLTTPPIRPGKTFVYRLRLRQSGTYWYHSHTMLQEQVGLYGAIIIHPRKEAIQVDKEVTVLFSDWADDRPAKVLNTLRRADEAGEWYSIKKGYAQSLDKLLKHHAWGERLKNAARRMPPMDVADVYYDRFLLNGASKLDLTQFKPGERVRLRFINGSASSYCYLQYAGAKLEIVAADGIDVEPVKVDRMLVGIAETYDFVITIPAKGTFEFRATPMDVSGHASAYFGTGDTTAAPDVPRPDVWKMSETMMKLAVNMPGHMNMDMPGMKKMKMKDGMDMPMKEEDGMKMKKGKEMKEQEGEKMKMEKEHEHTMTHDHNMMGKEVDGKAAMDMKKDSMVMYSYNMLRSIAPTAFDTRRQVRTVKLKLTGTMFRYIWSMDNRTLSEADYIEIKKWEVVRFEMQNTTMMNHPMHLHGHFFRVLTSQGDHSPLKHTVDVPPMSTITIEFDATEDKSWFFHCHILYHMMSGMARVVHYEGSERDSILEPYNLRKFINEERKLLFYGSAALKSNLTELNLNLINLKNAFRMEANLNYTGQYEANLSYERYLNNWLRPYIGVTAIRQKYYSIASNEQVFDQEFNLPVAGIRYTLPFFIEADLRVNMAGRVRLGLEGEAWLLPRIFFDWRANTDKEYHLDLQYMLGRNFSLAAGYDSRYKWGGGLLMRF